MVVADAGGDAVVDDHAVLIKHQAVAAAARGELAPSVGVNAVEQFARVGALNVDLAEGGGVHDRQALTRRQAFAGDGSVHAFVGALLVVARAEPLPDQLPDDALALVPGVDGRVAFAIKVLTGLRARERAEGYACVRRSVGGYADLGDAGVEDFGGDGAADDVTNLALVRAEAHGGVALDVLDVAVVFGDGLLDVRQGDVVLHVDKGVLSSRDKVKIALLQFVLADGRAPSGVVHQGFFELLGLELDVAGGEIGADGAEGVAVFELEVGGEALLGAAPFGLAAGVAIKMQRRTPASGYA